MQGTCVQSFVQEDSVCCRATVPMSCNSWAWARVWEPQLLSQFSATEKATAVRSLCTAMKSTFHLLQLEKAPTQKWRPSATKNKYIKQIEFFIKLCSTDCMYLKHLLKTQNAQPHLIPVGSKLPSVVPRNLNFQEVSQVILMHATWGPLPCVCWVCLELWCTAGRRFLLDLELHILK